MGGEDSVPDALMNKPKLRIVEQCRAKGRRARRVRVEGVASSVGWQARVNVSSEGQLDASVSMSDCVIPTAWSCVSLNSLEVIKFIVFSECC